jgi:hypothetical protein
MSERPEQEPLQQGRDYYIENGKWVFTADFLRRRGYCCESACRHCPYGFTREMLQAKLAAQAKAESED